MSEMLALGNSVLGEVHGTVAGTITPRGGAAVNFTGARITRHRSTPAGDEQAHDELDLSLPVAGIASAPARDSTLAISGTPPTGVSAGPWYVHVVSRQAPGGEAIAYRIEARRTYINGVLQTWAPGTTGG